MKAQIVAQKEDGTEIRLGFCRMEFESDARGGSRLEIVTPDGIRFPTRLRRGELARGASGTRTLARWNGEEVSLRIEGPVEEAGSVLRSR